MGSLKKLKLLCRDTWVQETMNGGQINTLVKTVFTRLGGTPWLSIYIKPLFLNAETIVSAVFCFSTLELACWNFEKSTTGISTWEGYGINIGHRSVRTYLPVWGYWERVGHKIAFQKLGTVVRRTSSNKVNPNPVALPCMETSISPQRQVTHATPTRMSTALAWLKYPSRSLIILTLLSLAVFTYERAVIPLYAAGPTRYLLNTIILASIGLAGLFSISAKRTLFTTSLLLACAPSTSYWVAVYTARMRDPLWGPAVTHIVVIAPIVILFTSFALEFDVSILLLWWATAWTLSPVSWLASTESKISFIYSTGPVAKNRNFLLPYC